MKGMFRKIKEIYHLGKYIKQKERKAKTDFPLHINVKQIFYWF